LYFKTTKFFLKLALKVTLNIKIYTQINSGEISDLFLHFLKNYGPQQRRIKAIRPPPPQK